MDVKLGSRQRVAMSIRFSPKFQEMLGAFPEHDQHTLEELSIYYTFSSVVAMIDESDETHETILLIKALYPSGLVGALMHEEMHVVLYRLGMPEAARAFDSRFVERLVDEWFDIRFPSVPWSGNE